MQEPEHADSHQSREPDADGSRGDPRLEIPEVLRKPIRRSGRSDDPARSAKLQHEQAKTAKSWAIAMNFVYGVVGMGFLGWAIQEWWLVNTKPWPLLIGLFIGLIGGFARFIQEALKANREG